MLSHTCGGLPFDWACAACVKGVPHGVPNARFWVWANDGWVKLTLREGQSLEHCAGGPCDEGYSYESTRWTHAGNHVVREWGVEALDCDGRLDRCGEDHCPLELLASFDVSGADYPTWAGIMAPDWQRGNYSVRDYEAEKAGY